MLRVLLSPRYFSFPGSRVTLYQPFFAIGPSTVLVPLMDTCTALFFPSMMCPGNCSSSNPVDINGLAADLATSTPFRGCPGNEFMDPDWVIFTDPVTPRKIPKFPVTIFVSVFGNGVVW